jgi:hypothetical protein
MANLKITNVPQVSSVASTDDFYIKTGNDFRRVPVSKLLELVGTDLSNAKQGSGFTTCSTAAATAAKTAALTDYELVAGGFVTVKFENSVPSGATLSINSKTAKAIYYNGAAIAAGAINAGDIAVFVYDGTYYQVAAILPAGANVVPLSVSGTTLTLNMSFAAAAAIFSGPWQTYLSAEIDTNVSLLMRPTKVDSANNAVCAESTIGDTRYTVTLTQVGGNAYMTGTLEIKTVSGDPAEVTLSGSTVTIAEAQDNTVYVCGEVSSLTVTARAANAAFTLIFDSPSGSTPTALTMPASNVIMPNDFSVDVYSHYEINVDKRGYAVAASWSFD